MFNIDDRYKFKNVVNFDIYVIFCEWFIWIFFFIEEIINICVRNINLMLC